MMSLGPELDLRDVRYKGTSPMSGEYFVEDVTSSDGELTRRLVFQSVISTVRIQFVKFFPKKIAIF